MLKAGVAGRRGHREVAANHVRSGLANTMEEQFLLIQLGDLYIFRGEAMGHLTAFVEHEDGTTKIYLSSATWNTLNYHGPAVEQFITDMREACAGMQFIVADRAPYRDAVLKQAKAEGTDVIRGKDAITQLTEKANALVLQAASLNQAPTAVQQQAFAVRYALLRQELAELQTRVDGLGDLIDLAGSALYDTTT